MLDGALCNAVMQIDGGATPGVSMTRARDAVFVWFGVCVMYVGEGTLLSLSPAGVKILNSMQRIYPATSL